MIKSFSLGGKKYRVELCKDKNTTYLGKAFSPINKVVVWDNWQGDKVPEDSMEQTLFHEVIHCAFAEIGRNDLSENEQLVQSLAVLLHQFYRTAK